ncbi:hypothetical protein ACFYKX_11060 [Cytobacillus sp. FJAT-54145]|uniref:Uncharacterized protein n=1 Tax=Cytobacillus spartinae TaxID=3299023 RepID=A0ABW6KE09_9BACI
MYRRYKIPRTEIAVACVIHVDEPKKMIHVLDLNEEGTRSVTNGIDDLQPLIIREVHVAKRIEDYTWILYGTDGVASRFENGAFTPIEDAACYRPFLQVSRGES